MARDPRLDRDAAQRGDALASIDILRGLDLAARQALAARCRWHTYAAGQQIVGHQDDSRDVHFIVSGRVRINLYAASGREVTFRDQNAGGMYGELAAIDGSPRSASVIALTDTTIAALPPASFWQALRDHPDIAAETLRRLAMLVRSLSERVYEFSTLAVKNRLHAELLRLCRDHMTGPREAVIDPSPTHAEIASRISTHREAVTRELSELARAGLVQRRGHALVVLDVGRLARLVEEVDSA
jgi:CRP-like cAMP-binding protein